jgi:hypothetical protein
MDERSDTPSVADLAGQAGALAVGLTTVTIQIFPFALPLLILVIGPLTVLALAGLLLAIPILLPLWLGRRALRALRSRSKSEPADHHRWAPPAQQRAAPRRDQPPAPTR